MAQKSTVVKEFSIGKNTYKVDKKKVISFSDEITAKYADNLKAVVEEPKKKASSE